MRYWLLQDRAPSVDVAARSRQVIMRSRRAARIAVGDELVLLTRLSWPHAFTHTAKVRHVEHKQIEKQDEGGFVLTTVSIEEWKPIDGSPELDTMAFSLTFVQNLERPLLHFRKGYRTLPEVDFETILRGQPFLSRTAYFELLNAVPQEIRLTFQSMEFLRPSQARRNDRYAERLARLWHYIVEQVVIVGDSLIELDALIHQTEIFQSDNHQIEHRITEEGGLRTDSIEVQAGAFRAFKAQMRRHESESPDAGGSSQDLVGEILMAARTDHAAYEERFERIFADDDGIR